MTVEHILAHAQRELELALTPPAVMEGHLDLIAKFYSVFPEETRYPIEAKTLYKLLMVKNLSPLTDDANEWIYIARDIHGGGAGIWQNRRNPEAFSNDFGQSYYLLSEGAHDLFRYPMHRSATARTPEVIEMIRNFKNDEA